MIEPVIGLLFIVAPFVLDFDDSSARTSSIIVGVVILLSGMMTRWRLSLVKPIPLRMHFMTDVLIGSICIAWQFALGFSDETAPLIFFLVMGAGELGAALGQLGRQGTSAPARVRRRATPNTLRLSRHDDHRRATDPHAAAPQAR
jgi:hypothetical protein